MVDVKGRPRPECDLLEEERFGVACSTIADDTDLAPVRETEPADDPRHAAEWLDLVFINGQLAAEKGARVKGNLPGKMLRKNNQPSPIV